MPLSQRLSVSEDRLFKEVILCVAVILKPGLFSRTTWSFKNPDVPTAPGPIKSESLEEGPDISIFEIPPNDSTATRFENADSLPKILR